MLLENDPSVARAHQRGLERRGLSVEVCTSSVTLLHRVEAGERFECAICDLEMPALRGVEFFRRALRVWPDLRERILFVSSGIADEDAVFIRDHALPFLSKPFESLESLAERVLCTIAQIR